MLGKFLILWWHWAIVFGSHLPQPLVFTTEPVSVYVTQQPSKVTFRCQTKPSFSRISWLRNGTPILAEPSTEASRWKFRPHGNKLIVNLNYDSSEEYLQNNDTSYFQCVAKYKGQTLVSNPAKFILSLFRDFSPRDDQRLSVNIGDTAVIPCQPPTSVPPALTEFLKNDASLINRTYGRYLIMPSGNLQILHANLSDSGAYRCQAFNPMLNQRHKAKHLVFLTVQEPNVATEPNFVIKPHETTRAVRGSNVTLECAALGTPTPEITWSKFNSVLPAGRYKQVAGNLHIMEITQADEGTYTCTASNSMKNSIQSFTRLQVLVMPEILTGPMSQVAEVGEDVTLHCETQGHPEPVITWLHNGDALYPTRHYILEGHSLTIQNINKYHSGIYQCFASNELGSTSASCLISVEYPDGTIAEGWSPYESPVTAPSRKKKKHKRKKHKGVKKVPPSSPEVTRLSDTSALIRWEVPENDGLPINFFRVQYKYGTEKTWRTVEEEIPGHLTVYTMNELEKNVPYKFRVAAVYSNDDNLHGDPSKTFELSKVQDAMKPTQKPRLVQVQALSMSAIEIFWEYAELDDVPIEGFIVHYRTTSTAGDYIKTTVQKMQTNSTIVSHLLPDTSYEFKVQSFNEAGPSEFSNIMSCKTLPSPNAALTTEDPEEGGTGQEGRKMVLEEDDQKLSPFALAAIGVGSAIFIIMAVGCLCCRFNKNDKPPPPASDFPSCENTFEMTKLNISVNPLSDDRAEIPSNNNEIGSRHNQNGIIMNGNMPKISENGIAHAPPIAHL